MFRLEENEGDEDTPELDNDDNALLCPDAVGMDIAM